MNQINLLLIRHGTTRANIERRIQGLSDESLSEIGKKESKEVTKILKESLMTIDLIISSDSIRAVETSKILLTQFPDAKFNTDKNLREWKFGSLENEVIDVVIKKYVCIFLNRRG